MVQWRCSTNSDSSPFPITQACPPFNIRLVSSDRIDAADVISKTKQWKMKTTFHCMKRIEYSRGKAEERKHFFLYFHPILKFYRSWSTTMFIYCYFESSSSIQRLVRYCEDRNSFFSEEHLSVFEKIEFMRKDVNVPVFVIDMLYLYLGNGAPWAEILLGFS